MKKAAGLGPVIPRTIAGAIGGGLHGYYVMPHMTGYEDEHGARKMSLLLNMIAGAAVGNAAGRGGPGRAVGFGNLIKDVGANTGKYKLPLTAGVGADLLPNVLATMSQQRKATADMADATRTSSIPGNVRNVLTSNAGKGVVTGAAAAGIGGIISAMLRRKTEEEELAGKSRLSMAGSDTLRYLLPAMAAGGVVGSLRK